MASIPLLCYRLGQATGLEIFIQLDSQTADSYDASFLAFKGYRAALFEDAGCEKTLRSAFAGRLVRATSSYSLRHRPFFSTTMAGFVYACHPEEDMSRVKIGFTTAVDPEKYCRTNHARTLCPLSILRISAHANGRVAEQVTHLILSSDRIDGSHEVFNLATSRRGLTGPERLDEALNAAANMDRLAGLPVPVARHSTEQSRKRKAVDREELRQVIQDTKRRVRQECAAKHAADKEKERFASKLAKAKASGPNLVADWIRENVVEAEGQYLPVGQMVARYTEDVGQRITAQAFRKLAVSALPRSELIAKKHNHKNVFGGLQLRQGLNDQSFQKPLAACLNVTFQGSSHFLGQPLLPVSAVEHVTDEK